MCSIGLVCIKTFVLQSLIEFVLCWILSCFCWQHFWKTQLCYFDELINFHYHHTHSSYFSFVLSSMQEIKHVESKLQHQLQRSFCLRGPIGHGYTHFNGVKHVVISVKFSVQIHFRSIHVCTGISSYSWISWFCPKSFWQWKELMTVFNRNSYSASTCIDNLIEWQLIVFKCLYVHKFWLSIQLNLFHTLKEQRGWGGRKWPHRTRWAPTHTHTHWGKETLLTAHLSW